MLEVLIPLLIVILWPGCFHESREGPSDRQIKIGTIHRVKSPNILFDKSLGVFSNISHPRLFDLDSTGKVRGLLIGKWRVSEDLTHWTLILRDNYFWSDGVPVTAEDVVFSIKYVARHLPSRRWMERSLIRGEIENPETLNLYFHQPYTNMDIELASFPILPAHVWEKISNPRFYRNPRQFVGCGPFVIHRIDLNAGIIFMKKNDFWRGLSPALQGVEIHIYHNLDVLSLALERGDIDTYYKYADTYPYINARRLEETEKFTMKTTRTTGLTFIGFNLMREPASREKFRRAVARALNYREIIKIITSGYGEYPNIGFVPRGTMYFRDFGIPRQDIIESERLLDQCEYRDADGDGIREAPGGGPLKLVLLSTPRHNRLSELVAEYLGGVGLDIELRIVESGTWMSMKDGYDYDLTITRSTPWGMMMHAGFGTGYFDRRRTGEGVLHTVSDPRFLNICDSLLAVRDPLKKRPLVHSLQDYYVQRIPAISLVQRVIVTPVNNRFTGWRHDPLFGMMNLRNFLSLRPLHDIQ